MTTTFHMDGTEPFNFEVLVFGSNLQGIHGAGAAKLAYERYGAIWRQGSGLMGQSYGIATREFRGRNIVSLPLKDIDSNIAEFSLFTKQNLNLNFYVTAVGCGYAGYSDEQIVPLFIKHGPVNCNYPFTWKRYFQSTQG